MSSESQSYTAALANDPIRRRSRTTIHFCLLNLLPRSPSLDGYVIGPLSALTGLGVVALAAAGSFCLIPSFVFSKYVMGWPSTFNLPDPSASKKNDGNARDGDGGGDGRRTTNASNTAVGSITAVKTLSARSQMYLQQNGGPDHVAPLLMSELSLFGPNVPGSVLVTKFYAMLSRWNFYLTGRVFADQIAEVFLKDTIKFGELGLLQARTCWLDDVVDMFANNHRGSRPFNVVILGAGYDTRCYRLDAIQKDERARMYEVDAAGTQQNKRSSLKRARIDSSHVRFVPCDFETEDWMDSLRSGSDFDASLPSLFVWEGVSYYLDREVAISTIAKVSGCGKGSGIAFDYFDESCLNETVRRSTEKIGEPMKFGIEDVDDFVSDCNEQSSEEGKSGGKAAANELRVVDHLRCEELKRRYVARCNGRYTGYLSEFGGFLLLAS